MNRGFEFDKDKEKANVKKHVIDFTQAQVIWEDPKLVELPLKYEDEYRAQVIGRAYEKIWSIIITYRGEVIRIISARRARKNEVDLYES